jgi:hypothetical protein
MGFRNIINSGDEDKKTILTYFLQKVIEVCKKNFEKEDGAKISHFSDTIIVSSKKNSKNFIDICSMVIMIQTTGLQASILTRGALVYGEIFHDTPKIGDTYYGTGFIKAHDLEKQANYPRVLVDKSVIDKISSEDLNTANTVIRDFDGMFYIDPFAPCKLTSQRKNDFLQNPEGKQEYITKQEPYINNILSMDTRKFIIENLQKHWTEKYDPRLYQKYYWLAQKWNETVGQASEWVNGIDEEKYKIELNEYANDPSQISP